jgi:hypothetical protein
MVTKTLHRQPTFEQHKLYKKWGGGGLRCSCRVSSFWSTTSTRVYNVPTYIFVDAYVCLFDLIFVILICGRIVDFCDISLLLSVLCQFLLFVLPFSTKVLSTMKILKSMFVVWYKIIIPHLHVLSYMFRYNIVWQWYGVIYSRTCKSRLSYYKHWV